jgi:hypothetical protein
MKLKQIISKTPSDRITKVSNNIHIIIAFYIERFHCYSIFVLNFTINFIITVYMYCTKHTIVKVVFVHKAINHPTF